MEIMYPIVIVICVIFGLAIFFINFNKKKQYINGKKVANTKYIKETEYYKTKVKKYKIVSNIIKTISLICIIISSILIARPVTIQTKSEDIEGDRIGIIIYNTAPVVYCPLTDDYDYVNECLDTIEQLLKFAVDNNGYIPSLFDQENGNISSFWYGGIVANNEVRGSSLVGDGLARYCIFVSKY